MNFDQWFLLFLVAMTLFNLVMTVVNKKASKPPYMWLFVVTSVAYIVFYAHLMGVVGK